jgi:hypothetical protein
MFHGRRPTWSSPDIAIFHVTGRTSIAQVRVTNRDSEVAAANVDVGLAFSMFGIGGHQRIIDSQRIFLAPSAVHTLSFEIGRVDPDNVPAYHVKIAFPTDRDFGNNEGDFAVRKVELGGRTLREVKLRLHNALAQPRVFHLQVVAGGNALGTLDAEELLVASGETVSVGLKLILPIDAPRDNSHEITVFAQGDAGRLLGGVTYLLRRDSL